MKNGGYFTLFFLLFWFGVLVSVADALLKSKFACQGDKLRIRCHSRRIRIYAANFGRTEPGSSICPGVNADHTSCMSPKALDIARKKCSNKARCNLKADVTMFPDPCPKTYKYLSVIYHCVPNYQVKSTTGLPKNHERTITATTRTRTTTTTIQPTTTTIQPTTITSPVTTQLNITTNHWFNLSNPTKHTTYKVEFKKSKVEHTTDISMQSSTLKPPVEAKSGYIQRGQPKYVLILFLSGVAIATVLLLVLLLGLHLRGRRSKKFVMQQENDLEPNEDADEEESGNDDGDSDDENKNVTIAIRGDDEETQQISVKPGDIIIIDSKDVDNEDSEDLGYMSEIVRYYNSRNVTQDDGKRSLTCETPSVMSIPNSEAGDKKEPQYDSVPKANGTCVT